MAKRMRKRKPQLAFAAVNDDDDPGHVYAWTVSGSAGDVRAIVGRAWADYGNERDGWQAARKRGMRVVKIEIRVV